MMFALRMGLQKEARAYRLCSKPPPPKEPEADDTSSKREQHCPAYALSGRTRVNVNGEAYKGGLAPGESVEELHAKLSASLQRESEALKTTEQALAELKEIYGSLNTFVKNLPEFYILSAPGHEFNICIDKESIGKQSSQ